MRQANGDPSGELHEGPLFGEESDGGTMIATPEGHCSERNWSPEAKKNDPNTPDFGRPQLPT